jgi:hypothetical protein
MPLLHDSSIVSLVMQLDHAHSQVQSTYKHISGLGWVELKREKNIELQSHRPLEQILQLKDCIFH